MGHMASRCFVGKEVTGVISRGERKKRERRGINGREEVRRFMQKNDEREGFNDDGQRGEGM